VRRDEGNGPSTGRRMSFSSSSFQSLFPLSLVSFLFSGFSLVPSVSLLVFSPLLSPLLFPLFFFVLSLPFIGIPSCCLSSLIRIGSRTSYFGRIGTPTVPPLLDCWWWFLPRLNDLLTVAKETGTI